MRFRAKLQGVKNDFIKIEAPMVCVSVGLQTRGLLPDPNPRVPKYCRVSGRVSG